MNHNVPRRRTPYPFQAPVFTGEEKRKMRTTVEIPSNVSGLAQAAISECYEQMKTTGKQEWLSLAERFRTLFQEAAMLDGGPKEPKPRGRAAAKLAREAEESIPPSMSPQMLPEPIPPSTVSASPPAGTKKVRKGA